MLKITGKDFELTQLKNSQHFCLKTIVVINKGKDNERSDMKTKLETVPLDYALNDIVMSRLSNLDVIISLNEYVKLFKKEIEELEKEIKIEEI